MRIWHYKLLPYLPDLQLRGQNRELVAIRNDWRDKGKTNHILINRVMDYGKDELVTYFHFYRGIYYRRYGKILDDFEWNQFGEIKDIQDLKENGLFRGWHNEDYARVCMCNLYEKYRFAVGKTKISDADWLRLCEGYKNITGKDWALP